MTLLRAEGLTKRFVSRGPLGARAEFTAVDQVSFEVRLGETLAVVGESGSGKSTTARMIAKLMDPTGGTLEFEGEDVTHAGGAALARFRSNVQVVFQDPFSSLNPRHTVERILMAPLVYQGLGPKGSRREHAKELMERVGLNPDHSLRYPAQFSGGQAQRIGIARALAVNPKLVICDEAVSALDVSVQAQVIELLRRLQRESGFSYVFIAHDLAVVRQLAHRVAVMSKGRIVELGPAEQVFRDPQDEYTRTLLAAIPRIDPEWDRRRRERS
ncbi:ATP-binding cassette domain-containing protein [Nonomuraea gerenzanensis]|uniref:Oligopeptide transport ATP-binding protein OppF (TC 3.A.1.5.1) n=1 Tax=Nonomuraea gerenzanensis TaxID=93944 RepID=A0A1M4EGQ0_9ACTN|nr:ATP-binding cassette domain-containing protein [Nonomuraea gerenzanensis]SBO97972.1 Oligopeptide transport ATP-binding protein OppF (TC 3.A.1.5.1) [Nonomuraea gerenzanensis]